MAYAPDVVPRPQWAPVPSMEVVFGQFMVGTVAITVWRIAEGRTMQVRGAVKLVVSGAASVLDFEAPNGVPATYRAQMFSDRAGTVSLGYTDVATATLVFDGTCVHQPLDPTLNVAIGVGRATATALVRSTPGDVVYTEGAESGTWIGSNRRALAGVPFELITQTFGDADALQEILGRYGQSQVGVMCVRTPAPMRVPRTFFAGNIQLSEEAVNVHAGGELIRFTFTADEVIPPAPGLVVATLRRKDIDAAYPTRAARASAYLTRLDRDRAYDLAGLAG